MHRVTRLIWFFLLLMTLGCNREQGSEANKVLYIENEGLKAGILTDVGGRLVFLGKQGGVNLLKSDTTRWLESEAERPHPSPFSEFKAYDGHIIWPGPQTEWWLHQEVNPERRDDGAIWPPDPYLVHAPYQVVSHRKNSITLAGPHSPVSGITLTKTYSLSGNRLHIKTSMRNTSDGPVEWDLWSNARFEGNTDFFVPQCEDGIQRIATEDSETSGRLDGQLIDGAFTFLPHAPEKEQIRRYAKAYLHPEQGRIVAVREDLMLIMDFKKVPPDQIHPDQAFVEIYKQITRDGKDDLLELEHHSAHVTLQPGENHTLSETWSIYDYHGRDEIPDFIVFLKNRTEKHDR